MVAVFWPTRWVSAPTVGKTIEAGLVIAQMLSEGASRILIVLPHTLMGQWQQELYELFGIEALETSDESVDVHRAGVHPCWARVRGR